MFIAVGASSDEINSSPGWMLVPKYYCTDARLPRLFLNAGAEAVIHA
jgi:hypothetical protein